MSSRPIALLLGGTAQVGIHVLANLLEAGIDTLALTRRLTSPQQKSHPSGSQVWWMSPDHFAQHFNGTNGRFEVQGPELCGRPQWLLSTGPIRLACEYLAKLPGLQAAVCLSSSSVLVKADSAELSERRQIAEILESERQLDRECTLQNVGLVILRPTLVYGCGMDENISRMARFIRRWGFLPLAGPAQGLRQPIHVADLAELVVEIARSGPTGQQVYEVVGGSTLPYHQMATAVFRSLGRKARLLSLPARGLAGVTRMAGRFVGPDRLNAQMLLRQERDLVFDDQAVRKRFNFQPREFRPVPADFVLPDDVKRYQPD
jgi:uncharacterized protein YbjT (DUF2867 family)